MTNNNNSGNGKKIGMISLGCDKNRVDSENVLAMLIGQGYELTQNPEDADIILINTCAFIKSAVKESIDTILDMASYKEERDVKIVVLGCFAERYADEAEADLPEVDAFVGINSYNQLPYILEGICADRVVTTETPALHAKERVLTTPLHYAYLKISDGCNNFCTYCTIPYIRGRYRSYPMDELVEEAEELAENGVKELIVVAQDTTRYGTDIYGKPALLDLLKRLAELDFLKIRLLYAYPELVTDELLEFIATEPKMAKYIDIPLQHISDNVLKAMNRRNTKAEAVELMRKIKSKYPGITVRSTFIVGFPGEAEEDYNELKEFVAEGLITYAGFFAYSREEGTVAYGMKNQVLAKVKKAREKELSRMQSAVIARNQSVWVGKTLDVVYEGIDYNKGKFYGRTEYQAPDIDTKVLFTSDFPLEVGNVYKVKIASADFNLVGKTI